MLVSFGTHVRDREGKSVGTVSRLVLHPEARQVVALVVQQGIVDRREIVLPLSSALDPANATSPVTYFLPDAMLPSASCVVLVES